MRNWFYQVTGISRMPTIKWSAPTMLEIPAWAQLNGCCCTVISAWLLIHHLGDKTSYSSLYKELNPDFDGVTDARLRRCLKNHRIGILPRRLSPQQIVDVLSDGWPILSTIHQGDELHSVLLYGFDETGVYAINNRLFGFFPRIDWGKFKRPCADLICWGIL